MSNPFHSYNPAKNLNWTAPQKMWNSIANSEPVKSIKDFSSGLAQNIGSAYNATNSLTGGALDKQINLANPYISPAIVAYKGINHLTGGALDKTFNPDKKEKINKNLRTEGDMRAFQKNINALPQTFSKNLESTIVNAPEIAGSLAGMAIPGGGAGWGLVKGVVGGALPGIGASVNKDIDKALKGYRDFTQQNLNKTAKKNEYSPEVLAAMSPEGRAYLKSKGKTEVPKTSIRGEALDAMRFQAYKEHSARLKQLVTEGKITDEQAMKLLEDFNIGQGSQNFIADNVADVLNYIPEVKLGGAAGKAAQAGSKLNNVLRHAETANQMHLPLGDTYHQTKLPLDIQPQTKQPIDDGSVQTNIFNLPSQQPNFYKDNSKAQLNLFGNQTINPIENKPKVINQTPQKAVPQVQTVPQGNLEIPKVNSIGEYIGQEVVPMKQADLEANRANLTPGAIAKREKTINKYIEESENEPKTTDFRPLGTSFSPDTPQFISQFDDIMNKSNIVSPESVVHVGDQEIPFQNRLQEAMINYGNFQRLKRPLTDVEVAYKNQIDNILRNELGMSEKEVAEFLDKSGYVRANTKKSIDQNYSTKYNDGIGSEGYFAQRFLPNNGNPVIQPMDMNGFNQGFDNTPSLGNAPKQLEMTSYATGTSDSPVRFDSRKSDNSLNDKTFGYHRASPLLWDSSTDIGQQYNKTLSELNRPGDIPSYAKYQTTDAKTPEIVINKDLQGKNPITDLQVGRHEDFHGLQHEKDQSLSLDLHKNLKQDSTLSPRERLSMEDDYLNEINRLKEDLTGGDFKNNHDLENFIKKIEKETDYEEQDVLNELGAHMDQIVPHKEFMGVFKDAFKRTGNKLGNDNFKNNVIIELMDKKLVNNSKEAKLVFNAFFKEMPTIKMLTEKIIKEDIDFSRKGDHWINNLIGYTEDMRNGTYTKKNMPNLDYSNSPNVAGDLSRGQPVPEVSINDNPNLIRPDVLDELEKNYQPWKDLERATQMRNKARLDAEQAKNRLQAQGTELGFFTQGY